MGKIRVRDQTYERFKKARRKLSFESDKDLTEDVIVNLLIDMHEYLSSTHSSKTSGVYA